MSSNIATSCASCLPPELLDLIIDELQHDKSSLTSCSLVCKAWLPRSSEHLFGSSRISCLPSWSFLLDFRTLLSSSVRVSTHIRHLKVNVMPESAEAVARLAEHLPSLDSLSLTGIGLFRDTSYFPRPALRSTGRALQQLRAAWLPADLIASFLALFATVYTLDVRFGERAERDFRHQAHDVRHLVLKADSELALLDVASLVDPQTLQSMVLDLGGTYYHQVAAERVHQLLQLAGRHLKHFEYAQPIGGWAVPPDGLPALAACSLLESITITTPKVAPFSMRLWLETLVFLKSLPPQTQRVRLVTSCRGLASGETAFRDFLRDLDWQTVAQALVHCRLLNRLEIAALDCFHHSISFGDQAQAREAVLMNMPAWLRSVTSFV